MKKRNSKIHRKTKETKITLELAIDGKGKSKIKTGIPFLNHMLTLFSKHGLFDLKIKAEGDLEVGIHHTNEDVGICLGQAFKKALKVKKSIKRFGWAESYVPMDGSLVRVVVDMSNRPSLHIKNESNVGKGTGLLVNMRIEGGNYTFISAKHFIKALVMNAGINMHIEILEFDQDLHHLIEAIFKGMARALDSATQIESRSKSIPSTKGKL